MNVYKDTNNTYRKKLIVASPFPVYPPVHGGQQRIFHLYRYFAKWFDLEIVSISYGAKETSKIKVAPGMSEIRIPRSRVHMEYEDSLNKGIGAYAGDVALIDLYKHSDRYIKALKKSSEDAEAVIASHLFMYPAIRETGVKRVWYDSHNVEYLLRKKTLEEKPACNELLERLRTVEKECCLDSEAIMVCSKEDAASFNELYGANTDKMLVVPNGVPIELTKFILPGERMGNKKCIDKMKYPVAVFIGSGHIPNIIAADFIIGIAKKMPAINFIIAGPVGEYCKKADKTSNVLITGTISDEMKSRILSCADVALNPIPYGSGTNLKMLEYFAFGIPVISTPIGARGLSIENGRHAIICESEEIEQRLNKFMDCTELVRNRMAMNAREYAEKNFDWRIIAEDAVSQIENRNYLKRPKHGIIPDEEIRVINADNIFGSNARHALKEKLSRPILIWGAGSTGRVMLRNLLESEIRVSGFIDSDVKKEGTQIESIPIYQPCILQEDGRKDKPFVIIASMYAEEIRGRLKEMGYESGQDYIEQDIDSPVLCLISVSE